MNCYFVFSSITTATKIHKLLEKNRIKSRLSHTPKEITVSGCSYCVITDTRNLQKVRQIVKDQNVNIKRICTKCNNQFKLYE